MSGSPRRSAFSRPALLVLGCALALTAGCGGTGVNRTASTGEPTPPVAAPLDTQALYPEFQTPKWELAVPDRPEIDTWVRRFSEDKHRSFQTQIDRARFYVVPVQQIFEEQGIPKDIVFVALVESGFSPTARSHASAVGMWQFISSTGKRFGLEQNEWVDERRHPFKSARAAAKYLSVLYDMFGSWPLALAAYNAGENAVQGAQIKSGLKSFWELAEAGCLPSETREYVPKVLATIKIIRSPQQYGFHFDPQHYEKRHETVSVPGGVKLSTIEKKTGVPKSCFQECNPELCQPETPPWCSSYELCVPVGTREMVVNAIAQGGLKEEKPAAIESADKVKEAASPRPPATLSHVAVNAIGQGGPRAEKTAGKEPAAKPKEAASPRPPATLSHKVSPGETWFSLSKKYGCTPQALALLNNTSVSSPIKMGNALKVPSSEPLPPVATAEKKAGTARSDAAVVSKEKKPILLAKKLSSPANYPVRQGDMLRPMTGKASVPVTAPRARNDVTPNQKPAPGKQLTTHSSKQEPKRPGK